jgi:hypothetical protein
MRIDPVGIRFVLAVTEQEAVMRLLAAGAATAISTTLSFSVTPPTSLCLLRRSGSHSTAWHHPWPLPFFES